MSEEARYPVYQIWLGPDLPGQNQPDRYTKSREWGPGRLSKPNAMLVELNAVIGHCPLPDASEAVMLT